MLKEQLKRWAKRVIEAENLFVLYVLRLTKFNALKPHHWKLRPSVPAIIYFGHLRENLVKIRGKKQPE